VPVEPLRHGFLARRAVVPKENRLAVKRNEQAAWVE
jgi:hypothetical protein